MTQQTVRHALALDLVDDPAQIAAYEKAHQKIWPEVRDHLRTQGVENMEIYRLGTRLFMLMEVNPAVFNADAMAKASVHDPVVVQWEALMGAYQRPTPWTPASEKWTPMQRIFELATQ
jgi:L-rhamnose mutarotase